MKTRSWCVSVAAAALVTGPAANAQVPFALSASLTNGTFIRSVTAADVDHDGRPDLICVRGNPSRLYVWTNSAGGVLGSNAVHTVGSFPYHVIAADVNDDGRPDLVTANSTGNSLTLLTNAGNGVFALAATLAAGAGTSPHAVAAADLNGDSRPDLVSANSAAASITIWTNAGGGIFVSNASYSVVGSPGWNVPQSVAVADLNDDGAPDIICGGNNSYPYLNIWINDGAGGFVISPVPALFSAISWVVTTDVNADGKADLVCATSQVTVFTNDGSGGLVLSGNFPVGPNPYAVVAADINGDEKVDLITPNQGNNTLSVLTNDGSGWFGSNTTVNVGSGPESLTAADVNGDGRRDLISGNWNAGTLTVVTNAGTFLPYLTLERAGDGVIVSWPAIWANWTLQQNASLKPDDWTSFSGFIGNNGVAKHATNSPIVDTRFFRLSGP